MLKYILVGILATSGYYAWTSYPISHGPGVLVTDKPTLSFTAWTKPFNFKGNTLTPIKGYSAEVRVLRQKRYFLEERKELSPFDVIIGWNEMSDERNLQFVQFSIQKRSFKVNYTKPPIPTQRINDQIELLHLIPSTSEIEKDLNWLRSGTIIRLEGKIVNVESPDNFDWNSTINQTQGDNKKRKIVWVETLEIL